MDTLGNYGEKMLKIGITFRITNADSYEETRDSLSHDWPIFLEKINAVPIWIPNSLSNLTTFLEQMKLDEIKLAEPMVPAGFPSPADDFVEMELNIHDYIVKNKDATFCVRVEGTSMKKADIYSGDILIVDRSLQPEHNNIVLAVIDGEFTVKRLAVNNDSLYLSPENDNFNPIKITEEMNFLVWGVITHIIHKAI